MSYSTDCFPSNIDLFLLLSCVASCFISRISQPYTKWYPVLKNLLLCIIVLEDYTRIFPFSTTAIIHSGSCYVIRKNIFLPVL